MCVCLDLNILNIYIYIYVCVCVGVVYNLLKCIQHCQTTLTHQGSGYAANFINSVIFLIFSNVDTRAYILQMSPQLSCSDTCQI